MNAEDLTMFKKYVRADDYAQDDEMLMFLLNSAETAALNYMQCSKYDVMEAGCGEYPQDLKKAIFVIAAADYANPEGYSPGAVNPLPFGCLSILNHYRQLTHESGTIEI